MLRRILVVTIATAVSVGAGAAAPRWSGTHKMSYPRSSARFALSTNAARDLKNRTLSPKRKPLSTNNLRLNGPEQLPGARRSRQALHQGGGDGRQAVGARQRAARTKAPDADREFQLCPPVAHPVDRVVRM